MSGVDPIDISLDDYIAQNKTKSRDSNKKKRNWAKSTGKKSRIKSGKSNKIIVDARQNLSRQNERNISNQNITSQSFRRSATFDARQMIPQSRKETKQKLPRRQDRDAANNLRRARREVRTFLYSHEIFSCLYTGEV